MLITLFIVIALVSLYVLGNNYIVHDLEGYRLVKKKNFAFGGNMKDTRNWGPADWLKNPDITAAKVKEKWEDVKETVSESWSDFSASFDRQASSLELDKLPEKAKEEYQDLRHAVQKKHEQLTKSMKDHHITAADFKEKAHELNKWAGKEMDALKKRLS